MNDATRYHVRDLARITKVTVRTLHHYDRIGLLVPAGRTAAGYRLYDRGDLLRLQEILLLRELGMSLEEIQRVLDDPARDRRAALLAQREELRRRADEVAGMLRSVDAALRALEGDETMNAENLFEGFDPARYEAEAEARWGDTPAHAEAARRTKGYGAEDWAELKDEAAGILARLADAMAAGTPADAAEVMDLADEHRAHIDRWFYPCSREMHAGLAGMYEADPRFAATFEAVAEGLTAYLVTAIRANQARG